MSTIKVDTIATRTGSGNITASNTIAGTSATLSGTLGVTGATTLAGTTVSNSTLLMSSSLMQFSGNISLPNVGACLFRPAADTIAFGINNGQRVSVNQHGLLFGTDTAAANALDDYEEGTWTPSIGGSGATYTNQQGLYVKVGRYVCAVFDITVNARNSGSANELHGFPFTANNGVSPAMGVYSGHISFYSGISQNVYSLDMYIINGQTYAYFTGHTTASGNIGNSLSVWQNNARILGTVHYFAN